MTLDTTPTDPYETPESSPDPYATSSTSTTYPTKYGLPPHIDLSSLPSGLPIFGPLTGYTAASKAKVIQKHFASSTEGVQRPLTETEQSAFAYHAAKAFAISSWGPTLAIGAGVYRTYATRDVYRWPMFGKLLSEAPAEGEVQKGFWDGQKMRAGGKEILAGVSGQVKGTLLHGLRGFAYCVISATIIPLFVTSYAATVSAVGSYRDPRLQEWNKTLREAMLKERKENMRKAGEVVKQNDAKRMPNVARERGRRGAVTNVDDASPTGGAGMTMDFGIDDEQGRDTGGVLTDRQMRNAEARARPRPDQSPTSNRAATYQMEKVERQPKDFGSDFDADGGGATDAGDGSGGSVWERIRQQSASSEPSGSSTGRRQERQEGSTTMDDFAFSSSEEERSYAKSEAQKEFDERVEKERRGGDFSGSGGRKW